MNPLNMLAGHGPGLHMNNVRVMQGCGYDTLGTGFADNGTSFYTLYFTQDFGCSREDYNCQCPPQASNSSSATDPGLCQAPGTSPTPSPVVDSPATPAAASPSSPTPVSSPESASTLASPSPTFAGYEQSVPLPATALEALQDEAPGTSHNLDLIAPPPPPPNPIFGIFPMSRVSTY